MTILQSLTGLPDARSKVGELARGTPIFNGGLPAAKTGPVATSGWGKGLPVNLLTPALGNIFKAMQSGVKGRPPGTPQPTAAPKSTTTSKKSSPFANFPELAELARQYDRQLARLRSEKRQGERQIETQFEDFRGELGRQEENALEAVLTKLGSQGILRSGITLSEQGDIRSEASRAFGRLAQDETFAIQQLANNFAAQQESINNAKSQLIIEAAKQQAIQELQEAVEIAQAQADAKAAREEARKAKELENLVNSSQPQVSRTGKLVPAPITPNIPTSLPVPKISSSLSVPSVTRATTNIPAPIVAPSAIQKKPEEEGTPGDIVRAILNRNRTRAITAGREASKNRVRGGFLA